MLDQHKMIEWDLTATQACVLSYLVACDQAPEKRRYFNEAKTFVSSIADLISDLPAFLKKEAAATKVLQVLEDKGLVKRFPAYNKPRGTLYINITPKGQTWGS